MVTVGGNGQEIHCEVHGDGEPLLLIAGFACDHTVWDLMLPSLAKQFRVVVFDNRGMGRTPGPSPPSIREMADDAFAVLEALETGPAHVAGHSMGGMIAQQLALSHPQSVRTLTLTSTCAQAGARAKSVIVSAAELANLVEPAVAARAALPWMYRDAFFATPGAAERTVEQMLANPFPPTVQGIYRQSEAICEFDASARLGEIQCPTLVILGREDILFPIESARQLAEGIPDAEMVILERAAHLLVIESPDAATAAMRAFLAKHSSP
ncbi:MAG: alpha/beta fold hydrolase [Planctomycetales bacterium]|nr:alpha/beta fold hydrolase [Planctomycetales bacterium]